MVKGQFEQVFLLDSRALLHSIVLRFGVMIWKNNRQTAFSKLTLSGGPFKTSQGKGITSEILEGGLQNGTMVRHSMQQNNTS